MEDVRVLVGSELTVDITPLPPKELEALRAGGITAPARVELTESAHTLLDELQQTVSEGGEEAERIARWRDEIAEFGDVDWINFLTYLALSTPYASKPTNPAVGAAYSETKYHPHASADKPLDFRMGAGQRKQDGWYDAAYSELRITPRDPEEFSEARRRVLHTLGGVALQFGYRFRLVNEHLSGSAFVGEQPLLGDPKESLEPYVRAAAGLVHLHAQGAFYTPLPYEMGIVGDPMAISHQRSSTVRMIPGRVEFRDIYPPRHESERVLTNFAEALRYGFVRATPEEIAAIGTAEFVDIERGPDFKKDEDLGVYRILQCYKLDEASRKLVLAGEGSPHRIRDARGVWSTRTLAHLTNRAFSQRGPNVETLDLLLQDATRVDENGYLEWDEEALQRILASESDARGPGGDELARLKLTDADKARIITVLRKFRIRGNTPVVYHRASQPALRPDYLKAILN